jgi:hypothetical protein
VIKAEFHVAPEMKLTRYFLKKREGSVHGFKWVNLNDNVLQDYKYIAMEFGDEGIADEFALTFCMVIADTVGSCTDLPKS